MRQALIHLLVWIAAGVAVAVSFMTNGGWDQASTPPPLGAWATLNTVLLFGIALPALAVAFLVWGNAAGRIVGAALVLVWLLSIREVRRGRF